MSIDVIKHQSMSYSTTDEVVVAGCARSLCLRSGREDLLTQRETFAKFAGKTMFNHPFSDAEVSQSRIPPCTPPTYYNPRCGSRCGNPHIAEGSVDGSRESEAAQIFSGV